MICPQMRIKATVLDELAVTEGLFAVEVDSKSLAVRDIVEINGGWGRGRAAVRGATCHQSAVGDLPGGHLK